MNKKILIGTALITGFMMSPVYALTINGSPKVSPIKVCFDDSEISSHVPNADERSKKKKWVRDAIEKESWGYYTNLTFTGWGSCSLVESYDFRITSNGAVSYGNTIEVPFKNYDNPGYERYHIQSGTVHEAGHFLGFPHEHLRKDSTFYQPGDHANQKFRFRAVDSTWFTIRPEVNLNLCLTASSNGDVTQEVCSNALSQQFKFKDGGHGTWSRIEVRSNSRCLDIDDGSLLNLARLINYSCHTGDNQKFKTEAFSYLNSSETQYAVQVKHSSKWLDVPNALTSPGVNIIQYSAYFANYSHLTPSYDKYSVMSYENGGLRPNSFILMDGDISSSRSIYGNSGKNKIEEYILTKAANQCLNYNDVSGFSQSTCSALNSDHKFRIIFLDDNYFRLYSPSKNKCVAESGYELVVENCAPEGGATNDQQRFRFIDGSSEGVAWSRIQSKSSSQCLDVHGGGGANGTEIGLWSCHDGSNQQFRVVKGLVGVNACEFNDPVAGTTPGCSSSSVGGGGGSVAYQITKAGNHLVYVVINNLTCSVSISGSSSLYGVSGNCNNYRVFYK